MRIGLRPILLVVITGLAYLRGQAQFVEPTPEELKMTSDPKAPGAAAVYLNIDESTDDKLHSKTVYVRAKILSEKGKDLATVDPWYYGDYKVEDIKARTIHADGTIVPLTGKPEELLGIKQGENKINHKVFTLPSVEVGSIIEYRYAIRYGDYYYSSPRWEIQKKYYVHNAHFHFTPAPHFLEGSEYRDWSLVGDKRGHVANNLQWNTRLPEGIKPVRDASGRYDLKVSEIPAIPDEEWMPPVRSILFNLSFYYTASFDLKGYWTAEQKEWSKDVDHFADQSKTIKDAVAQLVAPADAQLEKAKKLYKAVQALDNTDFSRQKTESERKALNLKEVKKAEDTWNQKSGDSNEIAMLYLAMLRAAGLQAFALQVVNRDEGIMDWNMMDSRQFDDYIVDVVVDGKDILLDPGQKMCPFQILHWKHEMATGLRQSLQGAQVSTTYDSYYLDNKQIRRADVSINELGEASGTMNITMTGNEALSWRQMALTNDLEEVKKSFDKFLTGFVPEGVEGHVDHFTALDNPDQNLIAVVNLKGALGTSTAKRMMLPGLFLETNSHHPFVEQEKRTQAIDMHYASQVTEEVTYHLPAGFTVEGAVTDSTLAWAGKANFQIRARVVPNTITVARQISRGFSLLKPEEYQDLRGFYQKIATADQQQIVLTRAAVAAGN